MRCVTSQKMMPKPSNTWNYEGKSDHSEYEYCNLMIDNRAEGARSTAFGKGQGGAKPHPRPLLVSSNANATTIAQAGQQAFPFLSSAARFCSQCQSQSRLDPMASPLRTMRKTTPIWQESKLRHHLIPCITDYPTAIATRERGA